MQSCLTFNQERKARYETKITYPHLDDPLEKQIVQRRAERFEGLIRSFYIAAPLIRDNPEVEVRGILLKDYYKNHILRCCDKNDELYIGDYEFLKNSGMNPSGQGDGSPVHLVKTTEPSPCPNRTASDGFSVLQEALMRGERE